MNTMLERVLRLEGQGCWVFYCLKTSKEHSVVLCELAPRILS